MLLKTNVKRTRILGVMLFPSAAVKQKAKEGIVVWGGALFYSSVKRSPWAFGFSVRLVCAGCLSPKDSFGEEKKVFCFFWTSKERDSYFLIRV
jgi:hypothetical protein